MSETNSRRDFLRLALSAGSLLPAAMLLGCGKKPLVCNDDVAIGSLSSADRATRATLKYVDKTTDPAKHCSNCSQFNAPPGADQCGSCKVLKGPVNPDGYCASWLAKT